MSKSSEVIRLANYIEENLRASGSSGLEFIDPRNHRSRLLTRQNHTIFGRRGAGKTSLLSPLVSLTDYIGIYLNLENYKDITFPNIIISILLEVFKKLRFEICKCYPWYKFNLKAINSISKLKTEERYLENLLNEPDKEEQIIRSRTTNEGVAELSTKAWPGKISGGIKKGTETEIGRTLPKNKLNDLLIRISHYANLLNQISSIYNKPIYLLFDDFYFVPKTIQPDLLDYFHLLTKGTNLFLKVSTIKHRSRLNKRDKEKPVGVELGHDIYEIDIDYTLDNFIDLQSFMRQLLQSAIDVSKTGLDIDSLFSGDGFKQLCLASGGVPRDFLSLFVKLAHKLDLLGGETIGKVQVNEEAIINLNNKLDTLKLDSADEKHILELYLNAIKDKIYQEKRTNMFLVSKLELERQPQSRQAIRELVDLRLIHQVEKSTSSAPSDGQMYEAYILDIGLYDNARPRNFDQIEPGMVDDKSRKDELRSAPKLSLVRLEAQINSTGINLKLITSEQ